MNRAAMLGDGTDAAPLLDRDVPVVIYADEWGGIGGTAGYVLMLAEGLRRLDYRVAVICHAAAEMDAFGERLAASGVDVLRVQHDGERSPLGRLRRQQWLTGAVRRYRGCVLALMMGYFTRGGGVIAAGRLGGASAIIRADLTPPDMPHGTLSRVSLRLKDMFVDRVVVGGAENREAFARDVGRSRKKTDVIHTGIKLERFLPDEGREDVRRELGVGGNQVLVGTVSRLSDERKGMRDFIAACLDVGASNPGARFAVVGDGVLRGELEAQAAPLLESGRLAFLGWREDVPRLLAGMDVFVMPSLFEGGPTSVLEAMAMGKAVVATRVGMVPEVVEDGRDGLVVAPGNAGELAAAVGRLVADPALRANLGTAALARAQRQFSVERMVERYLQLFAEAVKGRGLTSGERESSHTSYQRNASSRR